MTTARDRFERGDPSRTSQWVAMLAGLVLIGFMAYADSRMLPGFSIGFLYLVPLILVSPWLKNAQALTLAAIAVYLRENVSLGAWQGDWSTRIMVTYIAFAGTAIVVGEMSRSRRVSIARLRIIEEQISKRREAEDRLKAVLDSSPLGIVSLREDGKVEMLNGMALRLLGFKYDAEILGKPLTEHFPMLGELQRTVARPGFSTVMECPAKRATGEQFWAYVWVSSFGTEGKQLAVLIWDGSEIFRDREGSGWELLLTGSRLTLAAVAHEMKNLTLAALRAEDRVRAVAGPDAEKELVVLRTSLNAIQEVAKGALAQAKPGALKRACQLEGVLEETSILISPLLEESGITLVKEFPPGPLPRVRADRRALAQVIVNLAENSARVLQGRKVKRIRWSLEEDEQLVRFRFCDSGPGVDNPDTIFQPFQSRAQQTGLGLAISRIMLRSFDGDLRYEKSGDQACFVVVLMKEGRSGDTTRNGEESSAAQTSRG